MLIRMHLSRFRPVLAECVINTCCVDMSAVLLIKRSILEVLYYYKFKAL